MLFKDVYMWFKHSEPHRRVEFVCGILNMCLPVELKFIRTFVENLDKRDDILKDIEIKTNKLNDLKQLGKVLDERTRSKLILYLALLDTNNQTCSKLLFDCLINSLSDCKNDEYLANTSRRDKDCYNKDLQLILTMLIHHPAFRYKEAKVASEKLTLLDNYEEKTSDCWHVANPAKIGSEQTRHHLSNLPNEANHVMEACDSGLSIGTEPEGEILSDHSCVPNQSDKSFPLLMCSTIVPPDKIEDNSRKDNLWHVPCPMLPGPVVNAPMPCKTNEAVVEPVKIIAQQDLNIAPTQGAVNSSSGESLNMSGVSTVPTAYIYNSSIYERTALETSSNSIVAKKEPQPSQRHQVNAPKPSDAKPLWIGSVSNPSVSSTFVSPLQSSHVPSSRMVTSIVTTNTQSSMNCQKSSLSSGVMTSVVASRATTRPAPLPRQMSSSSSSSSHPSSPAMIIGPKNTRYPAPTNRRVSNEKISHQQNYNTPFSHKDDLHSIISGPLSNTISFIPSIDDCNPVSTSQKSAPIMQNNDVQGNFKFLVTQSSAKHNETSLTTTVTTTVAVSSSPTTAKNFKGSQMSVVSTNMGPGNHYKHLHHNDTEKHSRIENNKMRPRLNTVTSNCPHANNHSVPMHGTVLHSQSTPFIPPSGSARMSGYTYYPQSPIPNSSIYYASKPNTSRVNGKNHTNHRRNARVELADVKQTQMENSTSSSQYSSPSQTPSPDIKKTDKSEMGDVNEACYSIVGSHSLTDNNSPPPLYNQYPGHGSHPRHRYMPFPQPPLGFIPYPQHPPGVYRYPMPSPHIIMGTRPPPSGGEKSSRGATPPSVTLEGPTKPVVSPTPSSSVSMNRTSSASPPGHAQDGPVPMAPPPNHIGHGPLPFNGPNYQMFPQQFFTPVANFVPGHGSIGNGFVSQMPPNFPLPQMTTELVYPNPYPIVGAVPQTPSPVVPPYPAVMSGKPRSRTCYNCGQVGHMGSDCKESSMVELTNCST